MNRLLRSYAGTLRLCGRLDVRGSEAFRSIGDRGLLVFGRTLQDHCSYLVAWLQWMYVEICDGNLGSQEKLLRGEILRMYFDSPDPCTNLATSLVVSYNLIGSSTRVVE